MLISDGNENVGDLRKVARIARANNIPIDVLPLNYDHQQEVILERLIVPHNARVGQTIAVRCVLRSTRAASGKLLLQDNGAVVDLNPDSSQTACLTTDQRIISLLHARAKVRHITHIHLLDGRYDGLLVAHRGQRVRPGRSSWLPVVGRPETHGYHQ